MKRIAAIVFTSAFVLGIGGLSQFANAEGPAKKEQSHRKSARLFPQPGCNVLSAMERLRLELAKGPGIPVWDGNLPWPMMLGYWGNSERDTYITVGVEEFPGWELGRIVVTFRSICGQSEGSNYLAYGARLVTEDDFDRPYLKLRLRNLALNGQNLIAIIRVKDPRTCEKQRPQGSKQPKLSIRLIEEKFQTNGKGEQNQEQGLEVIERDSFIAERLLE